MRPPSIFLLAGWLPAMTAAALQVAGTDCLRGAFAEALVAQGRRDEARVSVAFNGSRPALDAVIGGRAGLALLFIPPGEALPGERLFLWPVAHYAVAVIANDRSALREIALPRLGALAGTSSRVQSAAPNAVAVAGAAEKRILAVHALHPRSGPAMGLFRHLVLDGGEINESVQLQPMVADVLAAVRADEHAIGLASVPPVDSEGVRVLAVAAGPSQPSRLPTADSLESGAYPLQMPLLIAFRREAVAEAAGVVSFLLSDDGAAALTAAGLVPLRKTTRDRRLLELESLR